ncbi:uncharacterized protein LOC123654245 [Melitaea cinxia]|uniref:uncharacterized protein LOC123654245 n=1 Tax=Melitaea cinxia TaxID=113334 RepID=UPI001E27408E|nr:uncharacterized protein LOC123654245 [Melitaea cinxia]
MTRIAIVCVVLVVFAMTQATPDNCREFVNSVVKEFTSYWPELKLVTGKPRHSQSQGSVERAYQEVENMLASSMEDNKTTNCCNRCVNGLKFVQFMKNIAFHSGIKQSPYQVMFGTEPKVGLTTSNLLLEIISGLHNEEDLKVAITEMNQNFDDNEENQENKKNLKQKKTRKEQEEIKEQGENKEQEEIFEHNRNESMILEAREKAHLNLVKQAKRMKTASHQSHLLLKVGDNVTIPIADVDKGKADLRNLIGVVLEVTYPNLMAAKKNLSGGMSKENDYINIHERAPTVTHLAVHLENGQRVYFTENNVNDIVNNPRDTTLTAFFKLCAEDDFAKTLTYDKGAVVLGYPGVRKTDALGRVYVVHPNNAECFHLRLLLHVIKGPTSFRSLRTFEGVTYDTFQGACKAMGLLEDDSHWESTLSEAAICCSPKSLRCLFAIMISFCQITDPHLLWQNYQESMSEDILQRRRQELSSDDLEYDQNIFDEALNELNKEVESLSGKSIKDFGFNLPLNSNLYAMNNIEDLRETDYDYTQLLQTIQDEHRLNPEQKIVYDQILSSVNSNEGKMFFLDAPGGTGKTFIINLLLAKVRSDRKIALAVASSGIAATLLKGGRTAHSTFKLPLKICSDDVSSVCNISKQSKTGNGAFQSGNVKINLSNLCALVQNVEELVETVYPDITNITTKTLCWFKERAILAPTNEQVDKINHLIISKFEAPSQIYYSVDTVLDTAEAVHYPTEFLNSLVPPGIPPHKLILKVGSPVILLRNLNPPKLCNGTRLKIVKLKNFLIECTILTGCGTGDTVLIPRIPMIPSELPFQFKRLQFPIKLAFGITINKAQGQTLKVAGIDLTDQCFSHGQLYVALSRVTCKNNLFVFTNNPSEVMNVVYKEIYQ